MSLERIQSGDQLSAREIRELAKTVRQNQTTDGIQGSPVGQVKGTGRSTFFTDDPQWFDAEITTVIKSYTPSSPPASPPVTVDPTQYGFKEIFQNVLDGDWNDKENGRYADGIIIYALAPEAIEYSVGTLVRAKRHHAKFDVYETQPTTIASTKTYARVTSGSDPGPYTAVAAIMVSPGVFADVVPTVAIGGIYRRPSNAPTPDINPGQHIEYWPSPTVSGTYECHPWGAMQSISHYVCVPDEPTMNCVGAGLQFNWTVKAIKITIETRDLRTFTMAEDTCPPSS